MMKTDYIIASLLGALWLSGCASTDSKKSTSLANAQVDALTSRNLDPGECGLFVWAGEARRFILFSQGGQGAALARGGDEVALSAQTRADDGDLYGQIPIQTFSDPDGKIYDLSLSGSSDLAGGTRYTAGTWKHKDSEGWDVVTPVYGLSTCRPVA